MQFKDFLNEAKYDQKKLQAILQSNPSVEKAMTSKDSTIYITLTDDGKLDDLDLDKLGLYVYHADNGFSGKTFELAMWASKQEILDYVSEGKGYMAQRVWQTLNKFYKDR